MYASSVAPSAGDADTDDYNGEKLISAISYILLTNQNDAVYFSFFIVLKRNIALNLTDALLSV